jgi:hypothetical protein
VTAARPATEAGSSRARRTPTNRIPAFITALLGAVTLAAGALILPPANATPAESVRTAGVVERHAVDSSPDALSQDAASRDAASQIQQSPDTVSPDAASPDTVSPDAVSPDAVSPDAVSDPNSPPAAPSTAVPVPTITSPTDGALVDRETTNVTGTRAADQSIQLLSPDGGDPLCVREADGSTTWSCPASLDSSPSVTLTVVDSSDSSVSSEITVRVLTPPVVTGGALSDVASNGMVRGTAYPGASVTVTLSGGHSCTTDADQSGAWACYFEGMRASGTYDVAATQTTSYSAPSSSARSDPVKLLFDLDRPAAPVMTSPANNSRVSLDGTTYAGTGEPGTSVTVFVDSSSLCEVPVLPDGTWTCFAGGVAAGTYSIRAIQQDEAGNVGPASVATIVGFGPTPVEPPPSPTGGQDPVPAPAPPVAAAQPTPAPDPAPSEASPQTTPPDAASPQAESPQAEPPEAAPPVDPGQATPPAASGTGPVVGGWSDPTQFAAAVSPPGTPSVFPWWQPALLALAALLLFAIPARLLAGTVSRARNGHPLVGERHYAGRNRARVEYETAPDLRVNRRLVAAAGLVAAAALIMLSGPITDQPAYLRLFVAVIIALVIVNVIGVLVPLWWGRRVLRVDATATFLPRYLLLVGVSALGSRLLGVEPALLFGLLGSVALAAGTNPVARGQLAAVRASSLVVLALLGWLLLGIASGAGGFLGALTAEVLNALVLTAAGSAVLVLMPVGRTSGRSILTWSPWIWVALTITAFWVLFGVLSPTLNGGGSAMVWIAACAFAAFSVGAWAWQRFVTPALN